MIKKLFKTLKMNKLKEKILRAEKTIYKSYTWEVIMNNGENFNIISEYCPRSSKWVLENSICEGGIMSFEVFIPLSSINKIILTETKIFELYHFEEMYRSWLNNYLSLESLQELDLEYLSIVKKLEKLQDELGA